MNISFLTLGLILKKENQGKDLFKYKVLLLFKFAERWVCSFEGLDGQ